MVPADLATSNKEAANELALVLFSVTASRKYPTGVEIAVADVTPLLHCSRMMMTTSQSLSLDLYCKTALHVIHSQIIKHLYNHVQYSML